MDQSSLDKKYFINWDIYNCPFCKRRHVQFTSEYSFSFDWSSEKRCAVFFVKCNSCLKTSIHFTYHHILSGYICKSFRHDEIETFQKEITSVLQDIDSHIFFSIPSSSFATDSRIPKIFRELIAEAEGCLKNNFLTGASVCIRKIIYELAKKHNAKGSNYDERIKSLKEELKDIDPIYFDQMITIQQLTSDKVHEESYEGWNAKHIRFFLSVILEILNEAYVIPQMRKEKREAMLKLKEEIIPPKEAST